MASCNIFSQKCFSTQYTPTLIRKRGQLHPPDKARSFRKAVFQCRVLCTCGQMLRSLGALELNMARAVGICVLAIKHSNGNSPKNQGGVNSLEHYSEAIPTTGLNIRSHSLVD
jgi:hypothetical protein